MSRPLSRTGGGLTFEPPAMTHPTEFADRTECVIMLGIQMKRLFPTSLALLLVMGSLGHVFAAAFCPRMLGHDCCLMKTVSSENPLQSHQHMHEMAMDGMAHESMQMDGGDMQGMVMDGDSLPARSSALNDRDLLTTSESVAPNKLELPVDSCTHCLSHSGLQNAPVSSVSMPGQSNKDLDSVPLPVTKFLTRPAIMLAAIGLPREHAPPGYSAARHIVLNVFLI